MGFILGLHHITYQYNKKQKTCDHLNRQRDSIWQNSTPIYNTDEKQTRNKKEILLPDVGHLQNQCS